MTLLWAAFGVMALVAVLVLVVPIIKHKARSELPGDLLNSMVYRDRLAELQEDLTQQRINEEQYEQLHQELELTLLNDVAATNNGAAEREIANKPQGGRWLALVLVAVIPLMAGLLYGIEGYSPKLSELQQQKAKLDPLLPQVLAGNLELLEQNNVQVDEFIRSLQRYLQRNPNHAEGWYMLGVAYLQIQLPQQGEVAFKRALDLDPANVDYQLGMAQVSISLNQGQLAPEMARFLEQMIRQDPMNPRPYMTLGMAFYQAGNMQAAIDIWQNYLRLENGDAQAQQLLQRSVEVARNELKSKSQPQQPVTAPNTQLVVNVEVSEQIQATLSSKDTLFVYAKAISGPPMPLAVVRQPVGHWPVTVILSDEQAMTPQFTLSQFSEVLVQARISKTGNAIPASGDWIAPSQTVAVKEVPVQVDLKIMNKVP